jgi:hypothetical protein
MRIKGSNMKNKTEMRAISRREFLKKLGGVGLSSAMLKLSLLGGNLMWTRSVFAATAPKRVVFVYIPGGAIPNEWIPSGNDLTLPAMSAPLEPVKQHCVFLNGVNMEKAGHGYTSKVLGREGKMTVDTYIAQTLGQATSFSHLQLGVISNGYSSMSRFNWNQPAFEDSPFNAFERLFGAGRATTEDLATRRKRSVLNSNLEALTQLRNRLGSFEKTRLDAHAQAIERVETRLSSASGGTGGESGACTTPTFNSDGFKGATNTDVNFDPVADLQVDVAALALRCDLTRVVSLMIGNHQCDYTVPEAGVGTHYHRSIHGRPAEDYIRYRAYFTEKLRYLIQSLASIEDMDGNTLLDNTLVLHVSDMADARGHEGDNVPYMLAGGGGGVLTTGRSLDLKGVDYNSVLDTLAQAMGVDVNSADYEPYGDGPISGIFN